jgi:hypothetical protein
LSKIIQSSRADPGHDDRNIASSEKAQNDDTCSLSNGLAERGSFHQDILSRAPLAGRRIEFVWDYLFRGGETFVILQ